MHRVQVSMRLYFSVFYHSKVSHIHNFLFLVLLAISCGKQYRDYLFIGILKNCM